MENEHIFYCPIVEYRQFRKVCEHFVALRKEKVALPDGNFKCSSAINGKRCPVFRETYTPRKRKVK